MAGAAGGGIGAGGGLGGDKSSRAGHGTHDPYELLQVSPNAGLPVIRAAYRTLARDYHPDVNATPEAARLMQRLNAAYDLLSNPERRARYDARRPRPAEDAGRGQPSRASHADRKPRPDRRPRADRAARARGAPHARHAASPRLAADADRPAMMIVTVRILLIFVIMVAVALVMLIAWLALDDGDDRSPVFRPRGGQLERTTTTMMGGVAPGWCAPGRPGILPC